jgi:2-phospho-L-lactate guanylyltransferase
MWRVIVPVKSRGSGKSRLAVAPALRADYAEAMAADTLTAIRACPLVSTIVALTDSPAVDGSAGASLVDQTLVHPADLDLNQALTWAAAKLPRLVAATGTAVIVADLPALRPDELTRALAEADRHDLSMVTDRRGGGTTLLAARHGALPAPRFGENSARHHQDAGAACLDDLMGSGSLAGLRCDVDTLPDLREARRLGLGDATLALNAGLSSPT